jgi:hypothetical protein
MGMGGGWGGCMKGNYRLMSLEFLKVFKNFCD